MAAYGGSYLVAAEGNTYTLGVQYTVPVKWGPVSSLQFYNDYGYLENDFNDTAMNVTGVLVSAGSVYTYLILQQVKISLARSKLDKWIRTGSCKMGSAFQYEYGYYF
jgi:hypothetical protein